MNTGYELSTSPAAEFWRIINEYAVLLSLTRRSLSRSGFRRLLMVQRGAAERVAGGGLPPLCGRDWLQQTATLLRQAFAQLESGVFPRERLQQLDHHFAHVAAGIGPLSEPERQSRGAAGSALTRQSRR
ncbi:MAG: hypothetical protein Kow001_15520 [Acidobacteriota bacterium]